MGGGAPVGGADGVLVAHDELGFRGLFKNLRALGLAIFASLGGMLYGYNQGVFSNVQVQAEFHHRFASTLDKPSTKGMLTGILELSAFFSAPVSGFLADKYSRKYSLSAWCILFMLGSALQAGATGSVVYVYAGRFISGLGIGALTVIVPMFNAELSPAGIRGTLVALQQVAITFGIAVSYWIGYGTNFIGGTTYPGQSTAAWRIPLALQIVPGLVLCIGSLFLPFSPRWLILKDRDEECVQTLSKLRRLPVEHPAIQYEYKSLKVERLADLEVARIRYGDKPNWKIQVLEYKRIFTTPKLLWRLSLGSAMNFLGQFSGINAVLYYAPTIFEALGLTGDTIGLLATGLIGILLCLFTVPSAIFIDNLGRKPLVIGGGISMTIAHAGIAGIMATYGDSFDTHKSAGIGAIFLVFWYICTYGCTWGAANWVIVAETLPLDIRGKGMGISTAVIWIANFAVAELLPVMIDSIGYKTFIVFMVFCILGVIWGFFALPELKGLSLEEVDKVFHDTSQLEYNAIRDRIAEEQGLNALADTLRADPRRRASVAVEGGTGLGRRLSHGIHSVTSRTSDYKEPATMTEKA